VPVDACEKPEGAPSCGERCEGGLGVAGVQKCLGDSADCGALVACVGLVAKPNVVHAWDAKGPYGTGMKDKVGDFSVQTTGGTFKLSEQWTGVDSFVVLLTARDQAGKVYGYPEKLWQSSVVDMLKEAPKATHFLFASYNDPELAKAMQPVVVAALAKLPKAEQAHWQARVHIVTDAVGQGDFGWLSQWAKAQGRFLLGIDPFQRQREFGIPYLFPVEPQVPVLKHTAIEAQGWAFERQREDGRYKGPETVVELANAKTSGGGFVVQAQFPDDKAMAGFDTLEVEMTHDCKDHLSQNCGEWDYLMYLRLCEKPAVAELPEVATPCQPHVPANDGQPEIKAATMACACDRQDGTTKPRSRTCNADGKGFGKCNCACDLEFGRWITSYSREGTWWTDLTPQLAHLKKGGIWPVEVALPGQGQKCDPQDKSKCWQTPYVATAKLHFSSRGKGMRPTLVFPIWSGGDWNAQYNDKHKPLEFTLPASAKKVTLAAFITGHGFGKDQANCAEFCNHSHHFRVNGGKEHVKSHPEAGNKLGCKAQIGDGTVPNQLGTWPLGRGGWCPGLDVKLWQADVTADVKLGQKNVFSYEGMLNGKPYVPVPQDAGSGFGARIDLTGWVVVWD
jgi:hypothetical protein